MKGDKTLMTKNNKTVIKIRKVLSNSISPIAVI